jgi:dUTP pyrophosphatase
MEPLRVKLLSERAIEPTRGSPHSAGLDLYAPEGSMFSDVMPGERKLIKMGLAVAIPPGYYGRIAPRSGLAMKNGIQIMAGVIDADYRGELGVILYNAGAQPFSYNRGERIAQLILERIAVPDVLVVDDLDDTDRGSGGFGSTGV